MAAGNGSDALQADIDLCLSALLRESRSVSTVTRVAPALGQFAQFAPHVGGTNRLADVTAELAHAFVPSRLGSGLPASVATMHDRRSRVNPSGRIKS